MTNWKEEIDELLDSQRGKTWLVIRPLLKVFISNLLSQQKTELLDQLLEKGHGGGNWRRLIEQLKENND